MQSSWRFAPTLACVSVLLAATHGVVARAAGGGGLSAEALRGACRSFAGYDLDSDGDAEIDSIAVLDGGGPDPGAAAPLVLVILETRLTRPLDADETVSAELERSVRRYVGDLRGDGWDARLVTMDVYRGRRHQDGRTLLAMRRFVKRVADTGAPLEGVVLIGSFPEAFLVRSCNWRKKTPLTLRAASEHERVFKDPVRYLRTVPEPVAMRCDLVLADLDGQWEALYVQPRERLPTVIGVYPDGVPDAGGVADDAERGHVEFEDFFYVNDGCVDVREVVSAGGGDGVPGRAALHIVPLDVVQNRECAPSDLERSNAIARPDMAVSRINALHIALRPKPSVVGTEGEGLLDADGHPRAVRFADAADVPRWIDVWERDPLLERRLLVDYFRRNHAYRHGAYRDHFRPAAIGFELADGFPGACEASGRWVSTDPEGYRGGTEATLLDLAEWLKRPAAFRDLRAHSDPWGSTFGRCDIGALTVAAGEQPWSWTAVEDTLTPSLEAACRKGKADFALYRTMWANGVLPDMGCIYMHQGCDGISPARARDRPYSHPDYGYWQGAESLLFYCGGLALIGRAKVFYDEPRGFARQLSTGQTVGAAWQHYFELESAAASPADVGGGIGRKRAYFWSVPGDWTLRLQPGLESGP